MAGPREAQRSRLSVVFIGGLGRSGSTLLDRLLGQQPGCVAVGELGLIWRNGLTQDRLCGCGTPLRRCAVWESVAGAAFGGFDAIPAATVRVLQDFWDHRRRFAAHLLRPGPLGAAARAGLAAYSDHLARLLGAVQAVTGCNVVVDSSKTPAHLAALLMLPGIDVHVVHLVRDSRAVAYSWRQRRRRSDAPGREEYIEAVPAWRTAILWTAINLSLWRVRRRARSAQVVRYEDFVAKPGAVVAQILRQSGQPVPDALVTRDAWELGVQHTVAGNPMRLQNGPLVVRPDLEWRQRLPVLTRWVVTACTWPGLWAHGYPLFTTATDG
jgi:Sulfotransferase family